MNTSDKSLLEFVARLAYNVPGLSGELKLYFSQFLVFHFSGKLSVNQIQDIENKRGSQRFKTSEEIISATQTFSNEDRIWTIAAIKILQSHAEKNDDRITSRKLGLLAKELISIFQLDNEEIKIAFETKRFEEELRQFNNQPVIKVPAQIWPLALDYMLRWILLLGFSYLGLYKNMLYVLNAFAIPFFILGLVYWLSRKYRIANRSLLRSYGDERKFKIEYQISTAQYTWLAFFVGTSVFISYLLPDQLHLLALMGLLFYYFFYFRFFRIGKLNENDLVKQLEAEKLNTEALSVDENDEVIVALETKLNSSTGRLEAYVLESALFGALSFSGFLQIMATELISFGDLENFAAYIFQTAQGIIHLDGKSYQAGIVGLSNKTSLFCLVSVESLICSIFFLAVIASRLRFSDIADRVRTSINLAKAYNAKEEILHDEQEVTGKKMGGRLDLLTAKVNAQLHQASIVLEEISPVMKYMEYFRNAGILVFIIILVSSSLFITSTLGWVFLVLILFTYFYFNRAIINLKFRTWFLSFRIQFVKQGYWLFALALLPQVLACVLRIFFQVRQTDDLFSFGYVLIGLYVFAWLILAAHVDERFGEIDMDLKKQGRWKIVKNTLAVVILIFQIGLAFKYERFVGANEILILSTGAFAILMYFVGYYLTKTWLLGILCGMIFGSFSMGVMFKIQHWEGANEMAFMGSIAFIVFMPFIVWKRKLFHWLLLRFCIVGLVFSLWYNPLLRKAAISLDMAYIHSTPNIQKIMDVIHSANSELFLQPDKNVLDESIAKTDWYINQYGTRLGFTNVYQRLVDEYWWTCNSILEDVTKKKDTAFLLLALKVAKVHIKIMKLFNYEPIIDNFESNKPLMELGMESDILLAMGKKEEAIQSLHNLLTETLPEEMKEAIRKRIIELRAN